MGQAKARGSREQRIAEAQARDAEMREAQAKRQAEAAAKKAEAIAQMPPEARARYQQRIHRRHLATANLVGLMLGLSMPERK